jgi:hypothetical protein
MTKPPIFGSAHRTVLCVNELGCWYALLRLNHSRSCRAVACVPVSATIIDQRCLSPPAGRFKHAHRAQFPIWIRFAGSKLAGHTELLALLPASLPRKICRIDFCLPAQNRGLAHALKCQASQTRKAGLQPGGSDISHVNEFRWLAKIADGRLSTL